jgi:hypothetical protein
MATTAQDLHSALNACLSDKSLSLQVNQSGSQLSIMVNRPIDQDGVNYEEIAERLLAKLRSLNPPNISTVKVYGRPVNTKQVEWQTSRALAPSEVKPVVNPVKPSSHLSNGNGSASQNPKSKFQTYLEQFSHYSNVISAASLVGLLLLFTLNTFAGQKTKAVEYEYKIASVPDLTFTPTMDQQGADGWELVFARRAKDSDTDSFAYECIFKRVKR